MNEDQSSNLVVGPTTYNPYAKKTLGEFFYDCCLKFKSQIWQFDLDTKRSESYQQLQGRCTRLAFNLLKWGIGPQDVVLNCLGNTFDTAVVIIGTFFVGAIAATLEPSLIPRQFKHYFMKVSPAVVFVDDANIEQVENSMEDMAVKPKIIVIGYSEQYECFDDLFQPFEKESEFKPVHVNPGQVAGLTFSNGTTGMPKCIAHSHSNYLLMLNRLSNSGFDQSGVFTHTGFYWLGSINSFMCTFAFGGCRYYTISTDCKQIFKYLQEHKLKSAFFSPILLIKLLNFKKYKTYNRLNVLQILTGGTVISAMLIHQISTVFPNSVLVLFYGLSEIGPVTFLSPITQRELIQNHPASCGQVASDLVAKVVDVNTKQCLGPNQRGELYLKSSSLLLEYYKPDPGLDLKQCLDEDGFLKTGDYGYYDNDYCFYVLERMNDMFTYLDWNVSPNLVESVLMKHPAIADSVCFGQPIEKSDQMMLAACVVLKEDVNVSCEELRQFVAERVHEKEQIVGDIFVVGETLKTLTGKTRRKDMQTKCLDLKSSSVHRLQSKIKLQVGIWLENPYKKKTIGEFFCEKAETYSGRIWQHDLKTGQTETYSEMRQRTIRLAMQLDQMGFKPQDVVLSFNKFHFDATIPLISCFYLGLIIANVDPIVPETALLHFLMLITPKLVFVDESHEGYIKKFLCKAKLHPDIITFGKSTKHITFDSLMKPQPNEEAFQPKKVNVESTSNIFFSSGSTSLSKGCRHSHLSISYMIRKFCNSGVNFSKCLYCGPLYGISSIGYVYCTVDIGGRRYFCSETLEMPVLFKTIEKEQLTSLLAPPHNLYEITAFPQASEYDTCSLRHIVTGGYHLNSDQHQKLKQVFPNSNTMVLYGLSEIGSATFFNFKSENHLMSCKPKSSGKVAFYTTAKVLDLETGQPVGPHKPGELWLQSPSLMQGYCKQEAVFDKDNFFQTGDLVYYDDDECFYIMDRIKELFKYQGNLIIPTSIEARLLEHPAVKQAFVFGTPDAEGKLPTAMVVLKEKSKVSEEEIMKFLDEKISEFERLQGGVHFCEELMTTPAGKIIREKNKENFFQRKKC